jgi:hypothetical protein
MPKRDRSGNTKNASADDDKKKKTATSIGFRDRKKIKTGVISHVFKPKEAEPFNFSELEVTQTWPARQVSSVPILPTGSPTYEPGQVVHYGAIVPSNCFMRFTKEALRGIVGIVMDDVVVPGQPPGEARLLPLGVRRAVPVAQPADGAAPPPIAIVPPVDDDGVAEVAEGAIAAAVAAGAVLPPADAPVVQPLDPDHLFVLEAPSGPILPFVEKVEVMIQNTVVKTIELSGNALQRYTALANRSAKKKYGQDMDTSAINYYMPTAQNDLSADEPSEKLRKISHELCRGKNARFVGKSPLYGLPFEYDPVLKMLHDRKHLDTLYFGPGTHLEIRVYLTATPRGLRCLIADNPDLTAAERTQLWARHPRVKLESMWLQMHKICFPPMSPFLKQLEAEFKKHGGRDYAFCDANEMRHPVHGRVSEQEWAFSLQQLNSPTYLVFYFQPNDDIDGTNGYSANSSVFRFPPNLESFNITYQGETLLPCGPVTKLDMPGTDTVEKLAFYEYQKRYRRDPSTYDEFFDESVQQYVLVDLSTLYLQDSKMHEMDKIHFKLKFNNELSPAGWQIGVVAVAEKKLTLKTSGEHVITNAAGKTQT